MLPRDSDPVRSRPSRSSARTRFRDLPKWVQGWTAVFGVLIAALGLGLAAMQAFRGQPPVPTPIVIKAEAFIEQVTVDNGEIQATGRFRNVDVAAEVILFVGRPATESDARWLPVEAQVTPQASALGSRVDGKWEALRPFTEQGRFSWRALVVPAGSGAADGYEDVKVNGPASDLVLASSEEWQTGQ